MATEQPVVARLRASTRGLERALGLLLLLLALALAPAVAQEPLARGSALNVEAAYLVNFLRYTEWPPGASSEGPLVISVVGSARVAESVAAVARVAGALQGRTIEVQDVDFPWRSGDSSARRAAVERLRSSHLVHVDRSAARAAPRIIEALRGHPVLTVSNVQGFISEGGMLELFQAGRNIVFAANPEAIQRSGVALSSRVLQLARRAEGAAP